MNSFKKLIALVLVAVLAFSYSGIAFAAETIAADLPDKSELTAPAALPAVNDTVTFDVTQVAAKTFNDEKLVKVEHLKQVKNVSSNLVNFTNYRTIVPKGNVFNVAFSQKFTTKNLKVGDRISFDMPNGLYTEEGTMLLPCGTQIIGAVSSYTPPKSFNRNARVMIDFQEIIVPNSPACKMGACVYGKYNALQPSGWATFGKPFAWTAGLFGVGAGLGAAFGACAGAVGIGCLAIGMPVGGGVGLIVGLVTPGLHYKAKKGKQIPVMLTQDMYFMNPEQ